MLRLKGFAEAGLVDPAAVPIMRIAEIYKSVQGEGFLTGVESTFVRTSGCNLRCWYCDTPYTSWQPEGEDLAVHEILARVEALGGAATSSSPAASRCCSPKCCR